MGSKRAKLKQTLETRDGKAISLRRFVNKMDREDKRGDKTWTIIVNGSDKGIRNDAQEQVMEINAKDTIQQGEYFIKTLWPQMKAQHGRLPAYLEKYLDIAYQGGFAGNVIPAMDIVDKAEDSREILHIIGLIQLMAGALNMARKQNKGVKLYIVEPETHCHPARQSALMSVMHQIEEDYRPKQQASGKGSVSN